MENKNIFEQLKYEHDEIKDLLKRAESCSENDRAKVIEQIEENLVPHARGEEKTLYAILRNKAQVDSKEESLDLVYEAYEEHRVADELLAELKKLSPTDKKWLAHLKVLKENLEHHIDEEENKLFSDAKKLIPVETSNLLQSYLAEKEKFSQSLPTQSQIKETQMADSVKNY